MHIEAQSNEILIVCKSLGGSAEHVPFCSMIWYDFHTIYMKYSFHVSDLNSVLDDKEIQCKCLKIFVNRNNVFF